MRPTNKHHVNVYRDEVSAVLATIPTFVWEVKVDELEPVKFKDIYRDNCNAADDVASQWLLAEFDDMCPVAIDSDVLVDKSGNDYEKWTRVEFEDEDTIPDTTQVMAVIEAAYGTSPLADADLEYHEPDTYPYETCKWPAVELLSINADGRRWTLRDAGQKLAEDLQAVGWKLGRVIDSTTTVSFPSESSPMECRNVWTVVPVDYVESDDDDDDEDEWEDGWHGILLSRVFIVDDDERDAEALVRAGFRVLKHEDTGTVVAQVTYCGMSNEASRARAGFNLAVEHSRPILTSQGWRRPVH